MDKYQERYSAHQLRKKEVLKGLLNDRHSTRVFSEEPVPNILLEDLYHAADRAPSSCDRKGVTVKTVIDRDHKALLGGTLVGGVGWVHRAPVVLLLSGDPVAYKAGDEAQWMPYLDAGCMVSQMYLAASANGLKVCFINPNIREVNKAHFKEVFNVGIFCGALAVGLPANEDPNPTPQDDEVPDWVWDTSNA